MSNEKEPEQLRLTDSEIDEVEVGRCSCGLVFYSIEYALDHVCLEGRDRRAPVPGHVE